MSAETRLDSIARDAETLSDEIGLHYADGEFWLALPDGTLGNGKDASTLASMRLPVKRRAVLLVRQLFLKRGACTLHFGDRKIQLEFLPAIIAGRTKEGRGYTKSDELLSLTDPEPGADEDEIPDPGALLESLEKSTRTLEAIDDLLLDPSAIASDDADIRAEARKKISAAKDKALAGLGTLGAVLASGDGGDRELWLARVAEASSGMVEEMADLDGLPEEVKADKLAALGDLKKTIARYFAHVDPNSGAVKKFSAAISQLVLAERREVVVFKKSRTEESLEVAYAAIIGVIQAATAKGSCMTLLPLPEIESASGFWCKIVLNMHHLVMAVQHGGFHMRADVDPCRSKRVWSELRAWDEISPPRIHIVSKSEASRKTRKRKAEPAGDPLDFFGDASLPAHDAKVQPF